MQGGLHHHALTSILVEPPQWFHVFNAMRSASLAKNDALLVSFGSERCMPPSLVSALGSQILHLADLDSVVSRHELSQRNQQAYLDSDIAVVGMSCKVAGADNLEKFWDLLCSGESQHKEVPKERFGFETNFREVDPKRKWFGNFIDGHDMFDHKFFKKSPRESAAMDPQQRHILQIAYQAVEQSGYFHSTNPDKRVGCYMGVCACDYENNIACHAPNAFSAIGNLKGFIAGKVSHYFGWTGPGLTIDTACSSSAVAVHQACRAIISGECSAALAGGTHVMTNPLWFQNLAGASFLSTTGQCKPFDAKADGYCRGEGIAAVFLKKLSAAVADGDQILGVIAATAVQQNENCSPIFVPNVPSLSDLFHTVVNQAGLKPAQISVVEAHGTGTAAGDPAEYDSIRQVLGKSARSKPLMLSSVKGLVGHIECTSGIVSMIKVLLMIQKGKIPPQASFNVMSPALEATSADNIIIPKSNQAWDANFRAALINNYGASGSNASMILKQPPVFRLPRVTENSAQDSDNTKYPFWFCGLDDQSLRRYSANFRKFLSRESYSEHDLLLSNISFNLAHKSNRSLDRSLIFSARSVDELRDKLTMYEKNDAAIVSLPRSAPRPVVLCFGGQVSTFIGLDQDLYKRVIVFRKHLDTVDAIALSIGAGSIFPEIFQRSPIQDIVKLQIMLFAIQYSSARSWIDAGVQPAILVGHSFGELTALCISQTLSLKDTLKMIMNRAILVRDKWGSEVGAMMAVEANLSDVENLLAETSKASQIERPATIACYNSARCFTLAGSTAAIDAVANTISRSPFFLSMKTKRLNVTNAFHCALLDHLLKDLEHSAQDLVFRDPMIPIERATEFPTQKKLTSKFVADHIRFPVYFDHAVRRITKQYPSCVFLEAGSNATVTSMANRVIGSASGSHFQAINITTDNAWNNLTDSTLNLWKAGLGIHHWAHQASQTKEHTPLLLPPYQFEKSRHWIELKTSPKAIETPHQHKTELEDGKLPETLLTFVGYQNSKKSLAKFRVNTMIAKYSKLIAGHIIAQTAPICPATVQLDLVIEALQIVRADAAATKLEPQIHSVENQSPICVNPARSVWIELDEDSEAGPLTWKFQVFSDDTQKGTAKMIHTTGKVIFHSTDDLKFKLEFTRFERLIGHQRCLELLRSSEAEDIIQGRNIYRTFAEIVDYGEEYRGLQKLVGCGNESAGYVVKKYDPETWLDACLADSFCQTGGIWVNCMTDRSPTDMFIANGIEQWVRTPELRQNDPRANAFHVFATHHRPSDREFLTDIFVYNADTGALVEIILGISYVKVSKASMSKLLSRLTAEDMQKTASDILNSSDSAQAESSTALPLRSLSPQIGMQDMGKKDPKPHRSKTQRPLDDIASKVKAILADLSGLELNEIKDNSDLADLGIDSLMGMEMAHEIEAVLQITLPEDELISVTDMPSLMKCVRGAVSCGLSSPGEIEESEGEGSEDDNSKSDRPSAFTPSEADETDASSVVVEPGISDTHQDDLELPPAAVMEAFKETKSLTDKRIAEYEQTNYVSTVMPLQTQMCISLTLDAFEQLGCPLRDAKAGQKFARISHPKEHRRLVDYLYRMLDKEARLIDVIDDSVMRTTSPSSSKSSDEIYQELLSRFPDQDSANKLTFYTGSNLAQVIRSKTDGIKLIFGTAQGRDLVADLYGDWPLNRLFYKQMEEFLSRLVSKLDMSEKPLKILEMGAGTGGTTKWVVPLLASLNVPIEYTFTDLAPSFVAAARKSFKSYPFMKFRTHDIEKAPADNLMETQHIVIASNAVHATHSLGESTKNMRKVLRPDGFLMMLEMTSTLYWVDLIFGLFEGWWFFDDGRTHAVTHESRWEKDLQSVGYGQVDWTDGDRPENKVEKLIIAMASGSRYGKSQSSSMYKPINCQSTDYTSRQAVVDEYVRNMTDGFADTAEATSLGSLSQRGSRGKCVLVTGATGSLGSHLIASLALLPDMTRVICLNRRSKQDPVERQLHALIDKGIYIPEEATNKLKVFGSDLWKPNLGLSADDYAFLVDNVTHIIHNAWLMNSKWPVQKFEPQLQIMRNMLHIAQNISSRRPLGERITFQFISSIATVGHWPLSTGQIDVPEERMDISSVLPTGYGDAKYICELMLDETLHRYPKRFRTMAVRLGQVAGSMTSGYWNPMEHLPFLWKSSQTLKTLPDFDGLLSWTPVNDVADTLVDLLMLPAATTPHPIYHIDNPVRQPWREMNPVLADALDIPPQNIIPFDQWVRRVRDHLRLVDGPEGENPAFLLIDFLDDNFIRMSCGGLLLDTTKSREHSTTLANVGAVSEAVVRRFVKRWKEMKFLKS